MLTYSRRVMALVLCLTMATCVTFGFAQNTNSTIAGTVVDQSGAILPNVKVTVRDVDTNITQAAKQTTAEGRFSFPVLPIGNYEVTFDLPGFARTVRPVVLTLNQTADLRETLSFAAISKTVIVTDDPPLVNTTNSEIGVAFDERRVTDVPDQGMGTLGGGYRDVFGLGISAAGVSQINQGNFAGPLGTKYSVNGNRLRSNSFNFDGQNVNDPASAGRQMPWNNPDAIQEFRMITNQFSAEHGGAAGSIVSVATRRGSNRLHGTLFEFHNSNALNSRSNLDKAGGLKKAPFRIENQFGGTLGGPIVRDKTFFFGSVQRWTDRNASSAFTISSAPTEAGRALLQANGGTRVTTQALLENLPAAQSGRITDVRYCYNAASWTGGTTGSAAPPAVTEVSPGQFICGPAAAPAPGWSVVTVPVGTFTNANLIRYNDWQGSGRVDQTFNNGNSINGRYMFNDDLQTGAGQATPPGLANTFPTRSQAATIGWTSSLSPTLLNELRASWSRFAFNTGPQSETALRIPSIEINALGLIGFSSVGPVVSRTAIGYATNLPEGRRNNIYQLVNNTTWNHGGHTTKWGADIRKQELASYSNPNVRGQLRYSSLTNFVADYADVTAAINRPLPGGQPVVHFNWTDWFFFAQDDWKVTRDLTLNLGLRYELPGNPIESLYPVSDSIFAASGNNPLFRYNSRPPRDRNNFMPRFGFNWNLGSTGLGFLDSTVLRGGYARTNDYGFLIMAIQAGSGFPFQAAITVAGTPNTMANLSTQAVTLTAPPTYSQTLLSDDFRTPYSDQYSLEVQRAVSANNVFRVGYVGTKGTGLLQSQEGNPITRCGVPNCTARVEPTRGVIRVRSNTGSSIYHSMQVSFDHRSSRSLSGGMHYTWSAFIDNGSEIVNPSTSEAATPQDPFNRNDGERARSTYDRPHRLTGNLVYELPFLRNQQGVVGRIAGGWQVGTLLTLQSGSPFTVLNGSDPGRVLFSSLIGMAARPNFAPDVNIQDLRKMSVSEIRRRLMETGIATFFRAQTTNGGPTAAAPIGNVPRNLLRSDGIVSIDVNIVKNFRIKEGQMLQLRADVFNLPNTRNFGIPNALANGTAFDFLNEGATDGGNRRIFLSLRYKF